VLRQRPCFASRKRGKNRKDWKKRHKEKRIRKRCRGKRRKKRCREKRRNAREIWLIVLRQTVLLPLNSNVAEIGLRLSCSPRIFLPIRK